MKLFLKNQLSLLQRLGAFQTTEVPNSKEE